MQTPCGLAFEDERAEGRAIVRVHILDPAALATSSQALVSFWPYGDVRAGTLQLILAFNLITLIYLCWLFRLIRITDKIITGVVSY